LLREALQLADGLVAVAAAEPRGVPCDQHLKRRAAAAQADFASAERMGLLFANS
jgi:hypothetical protein